MMALIAKGVIEGNIPTTLIIIGVVIGLMLELLKLPILPFAIGLYLPLSLSTAMMVGGLVSAYVKRRQRNTSATDRGVLAASGFVAGDAFTGVVIAFFTVSGVIPETARAMFSDWTSIAIYAILAIALAAISLRPPSFFRR